MPKPEQRTKRKREVKSRASAPDHMYSYCRVGGCHKPARAGTDDGLDMKFCRPHADHFQRHGSAYKGSYTAKQLNPFRQAALAWLVAHPDLPWVQDASQRIDSLYSTSGAHIEAFRLQGRSPQERAKAAWARLRSHQVSPFLVIAVWLAIEMALLTDPEAITRTEYRQVQAAKVLHRMVSGSHKRWEREVLNPQQFGTRTKTLVEELHIYPRSRGRVLRHIGKALEEAVAHLTHHHLDDILAFKRERDKQGKYEDRPYPKDWVARLDLPGKSGERCP